MKTSAIDSIRRQMLFDFNFRYGFQLETKMIKIIFSCRGRTATHPSKIAFNCNQID